MDLKQAIAQAHLICVDITENHNKFWSAWVLENGDLLVEYGRVGQTGQSKRHAIGHINAATNKMNTLIKQKQAKGYQVATIADSTDLDYDLLSQGDLIREEIQSIQHQWQPMEPFSLIRFHPESGQFRSPLGVLSLETALTAQSRLTTVQTYYRLGRDEFIPAVEAYLRVIPMRVVGKLDAQAVLGSRAQLEQQELLLYTLAEELRQVGQLHRLIQSNLTAGNRSAWLSWGTVPEDIATEFTDDGRSIALVWS
jgi:predicted DNA-binding WGR domain protein